MYTWWLQQAWNFNLYTRVFHHSLDIKRSTNWALCWSLVTQFLWYIYTYIYSYIQVYIYIALICSTITSVVAPMYKNKRGWKLKTSDRSSFSIQTSSTHCLCSYISFSCNHHKQSNGDLKGITLVTFSLPKQVALMSSS